MNDPKLTHSCCIVVLCGLPGCGKTTFASELSKLFCKNGKGNFNSSVFHVCYDQLFPSDLERRAIHRDLLTTQNSSDISQWKSYRRRILGLVREALRRTSPKDGQCLQEEDKYTTDGDLRQRFNDSVLTSVTDIDFVNPDHHTEHVWIIDDNMYYESMRYEYFQLARQFRSGFLTVHLQCGVDYALHQNRCRDDHERVQDDVIRTMHSRFEVPDPGNHWELNSVVLNAQTAAKHVDEVSQRIRSSMNNPVEPLPEEDFEMKQESRRTCSKNTLHQSDQILRKLIASHMTEIKGTGMSKVHMQAHAKVVNAVKTDIFNSIKEGDIESLCDNEAEPDASKNEESFLFRTIHTLFNDKVNRIACNSQQ